MIQIDSKHLQISNRLMIMCAISFYINRPTRVKEHHVRSGRILPSNWRPIPFKLLRLATVRPRLVLCPAFFNITHAQGMNHHHTSHNTHLTQINCVERESCSLLRQQCEYIHTQSVNKHARDSFFYVSVKTGLHRRRRKFVFLVSPLVGPISL